MKTKLLLVIGLAILVVMGVYSSAFAEEYRYRIDTTVTLQDDLTSTTVITVDALRDSAASAPAALVLPKYGENFSTVTANTGDSSALTVDETDAGFSVRLGAIQSQNPQTWSVTLSYTSQIGLNLGNSSILMLPSHDYGELAVTAEQITLEIPAQLGTYVTRGPQPSSINTIGDAAQVSWATSNGSLQNAVGVLLGNSTVADVTLNETLHNTSWWWQTKTIALPPDTNQQQVFLDELDPQPSNVRLDVDGNTLLEYRLRPRQTLEVEARLRIAINSFTYALDSTLLVNDFDPLLTERYTATNDTWSDSSISFDNVESTPVSELVKQIYETVATEYSKDQGEDYYEISKSRADTLVGELRANGIPARLVIGAVFGDGAQTFATPQAAAWAEVNIPEVGWATLDPSFEQNSRYYGVTDVQRVALALRGVDPDYPPGDLSVFDIRFSDVEPPATPVMKPDISTTKYMVLPGVSVDIVRVSMPDGVIVDNTGLIIGSDQPINLGSLAPFQTTTTRSISLLATAFTSESVQYGILDASGTIADAEVIAQATTTASYVPMIALLGVVALGFVFVKFVWPRLRPGRGEQETTPKAKHTNLKAASNRAGENIEDIDMLEALDIPEDSPTEATQREVPIEDTPQPEPTKPVASPQPAPKPKLKAPVVTDLSVGRAHQVTPEEIRKEMRKKKPRLIQ